MPTTYDVKLLKRAEIAQGTIEFTLSKPEGFTYRAGQYGDLVLPASTGLDDSNNKHGFSFASAPFEDTLRMATRDRPSAFKLAANAIPEGSMVQLLALWGDFTLPKRESTPITYLIGGIGITPVRSMIAQATHEHTGHKLTLVYANDTLERAAYTEDFERFARENPNFTFIPAYTQDVGFVDAAFLRKHVPEIASHRVYLSGPEGMVHAMRKLSIELGVDEDEIRTEEFSGY